jgi:uncharacterized protein YjbI with pentapeptide repeats
MVIEPRGLRLWPVRPALAVVFVAAIALGVMVFATGWHLLGAQGLKPQKQIEAATLFDLVKLAAGVVAGAGALVALVVAYRRQRVDEDGALRDMTRLHNERFTSAVAQLGDASPAVRLGGVHALAGLADDAPTRHLKQTCIDVLCAFLRLPYTAEADLPPGDTAARHEYLALREARHTTIRIIRDHLAVPREHPRSWRGYDFDFSGVVFDGGTLASAVFSGGNISFEGATFAGDFNFTAAEFSGGVISFFRAVFPGGIVDFEEAEFSGSLVFLTHAKVCGGTLNFSSTVHTDSLVILDSTEVTDGVIDFHGARFTEGIVGFRGARIFSGGGLTFSGAWFDGGTVEFPQAELSAGHVDFSEARFRAGKVDFNGARIARDLFEFGESQFEGGIVSFCGAQFHDDNVRRVLTRGLSSPDTGALLPGVRFDAEP